MPGASLRNAVKRITHKERSQPAGRARLGLLEKAADYRKRARNYEGQRKRLDALAARARDRNPDEFYHAMKSSRTRGGVHQGGAGPSEDAAPELVAVLKSQDLAYVRRQKRVNERQAEKLQARLHLLTDQLPSKHTVFFDDAEQAAEFDVAEHFDTAPELAEQAYNRPRKETLRTARVVAPGDGSMREARRAAKQRVRQYEELSARRERAGKLANAEAHLEVQRQVGTKGRKKRVREAEGDKPAVYKWKRERKR